MLTQDTLAVSVSVNYLKQALLSDECLPATGLSVITDVGYLSTQYGLKKHHMSSKVWYEITYPHFNGFEHFWRLGMDN